MTVLIILEAQKFIEHNFVPKTLKDFTQNFGESPIFLWFWSNIADMFNFDIWLWVILQVCKVRKSPMYGKEKSHWSLFDEIKSLSEADHNYRNSIYTQ